MEPYDSMRFHAWKRHEIIVWNHMVPCMESRGRLMNLDPGSDFLLTQVRSIPFLKVVCFYVQLEQDQLNALQIN